MFVEREKRLDERHQALLDSLDSVKEAVVHGRRETNRRLDEHAKTLGEHSTAIAQLIQERTIKDARLTPTKEASNGVNDEEIRIRITPKMWAALISIGGVAYTVARIALDLVEKTWGK